MLAELIRHRIQHALAPSYLEVIDDSAKHAGHAGSAGGGKHFTLLITADELRTMSRIQAHRRIYAVLADMMPMPIHALVIQIV
jgi:BolA protein